LIFAISVTGSRLLSIFLGSNCFNAIISTYQFCFLNQLCRFRFRF
jgi:hypothetical protein